MNQKTGKSAENAARIVEASGLSKWLGSRRVLQSVALDVHEGERVFVVGENGCGKSTLLQILTGVLEPDLGRSAIRGTVGFAPEKPDIPDHLLVGEWLDIVASLKGLRKVEATSFGVSELLRTRAGALSLGQRQRVSLASAWLGAPTLLVLDEPTNGLDRANRDEVMARLRAATAVVATHDRELADELATRIVTVRAGCLV